MTFHNSKNELYSQALQILTAQGYDIGDIVRQHDLFDQAGVRSPSPEDRLHPLTTPLSWRAHFEHVKATTGIVDATTNVPFLTTSTLRVGARLRLTNGQKAVLRARYGLTPTKIVEVIQLEMFDGTDFIRELSLRSDIHVPESERKHILQHFRISDFGKWYHETLDLDRQAEEARVVRESAKPEKPTTARQLSPDQLLSQYLT